MSTRLILRMLVPSLAISLMVLAFGGVAGWYVHRMQKDTSDRLAHQVSSIRAAEQLVLGIHDMRLLLIRFLITGQRKHLEAVPATYAETRHWLDEAEALAVSPREQKLVAQVRQGYERFLSEFGPTIRKDSSVDVREVIRQLSDELIAQKVLVPAHEYLSLSREAVAQMGEENQVMANRVAAGLVVLGVCGCVAGSLAGFAIARSVSRSIVELHVPIQAATGKLEEVIGPVDLAGSAGIEDLDAVLRQLADHVGTVVDRLQQSQMEALRADQLAALGQLAAGLAHELRNPLMSMKLLIQTAIEGGRRASLEGRDLSVLYEEVLRLERSIHTFLDFARPPKLESRWFDVRDLLRQTAEFAAPQASRCGISFEYRFPEAPLSIYADREQLRQVLLNLLLNAMDAMPGGGPIVIQAAQRPRGADGPSSTAQGPAADQGITIRIADRGTGLPVELGDRIFQPFISTKETGLGMGLPISRRIVEAHGGQIAATNGPNGGAVFDVYLPTALDPQSTPPRAESCAVP